MTDAYGLDPRIAAASRPLAQLRLCEARLQDDARFPWIVLVPRRVGLVELAELSQADQTELWREAAAAGIAVRAVGVAMGRRVLKLNYGQLGNVVEQLHLHVVARRVDDAAWPGPVWGFGEAQPYSPSTLEIALAAAMRVLTRD